MPRKVEVVVYEFSELSGKAKARAIRDLRDSGMNDVDRLTDIFKDDLQNHYGLGELEVCWSLGSQQGDGVAFWGPVNIKAFVQADMGAKEFRGLVGRVSAEIKHSDRYCHSNSMDVEVSHQGDDRDLSPEDWDPRDISDKTPVDFQEYLEGRIKEISKELEKMGYAEIEYENSDEAIAETIEGNGFEFLENGKRYKE